MNRTAIEGTLTSIKSEIVSAEARVKSLTEAKTALEELVGTTSLVSAKPQKPVSTAPDTGRVYPITKKYRDRMPYSPLSVALLMVIREAYPGGMLCRDIMGRMQELGVPSEKDDPNYFNDIRGRVARLQNDRSDLLTKDQYKHYSINKRKIGKVDKFLNLVSRSPRELIAVHTQKRVERARKGQHQFNRGRRMVRAMGGG